MLCVKQLLDYLAETSLGELLPLIQKEPPRP